MCCRDPCPLPEIFQGSGLLCGDAGKGSWGAVEEEQHLGLVITPRDTGVFP